MSAETSGTWLGNLTPLKHKLRWKLGRTVKDPVEGRNKDLPRMPPLEESCPVTTNTGRSPVQAPVQAPVQVQLDRRCLSPSTRMARA